MKILIGDDDLRFARATMPFVPDTEVVYLDSPDEVIKRAREESFDIIVTDLQYTPGGEEGFMVLTAIRNLPARKILWTAAADQKDVQEQAAALDADVLGKDELATLVGIAVSKTPLKQGGKVLVYVAQDDAVSLSLRQVLNMLLTRPGLVDISHDLKSALETNRYGLVVDTTTMLKDRDRHSVVAHDLKHLKLAEVPRVVCLRSVGTIVADITKLIADFLAE